MTTRPNSAHCIPHSALKELPPLMPQFLQKRRAGIAAPRLIAEQLGIGPPLLFTLIQLSMYQGSYGGQPITPAQARQFSRHVYSAKDHLTAPLTALSENGLLEVSEDGRISLTPQAQAAVHALHDAGREHVASLRPLPPDDLDALSHQLERAVEAVLNDPILAPRPGSHLAGSRSLATFPPDAPAMVRIEQAIYDLWLARDDAHIKAWREAEMEGPPLEALTVLWRGETNTVSGLTSALSDNQTPEDVESSRAFLFDKDYVLRDGDTLTITPAGVLAREDIERDTDLTYFASWPHTTQEAEWLRDKLQELVDNIPVVGSR